jgi:hypothetical protein
MGASGGSQALTVKPAPLPPSPSTALPPAPACSEILAVQPLADARYGTPLASA